ncbi:hypothetical protein GEMRC1_010319 [Eukaryota sp. GEM-RC1]
MDCLFGKFGTQSLTGMFVEEILSSPSTLELFLMTSLPALSDKLLTDISTALKCDIDQTTSGFKLVQKVNEVAQDQISEMLSVTDDLSTSVNNLKTKYEQYKPMLDEIDAIDQRTLELEKVIKLLDQYSVHLEQRVKKIA